MCTQQHSCVYCKQSDVWAVAITHCPDDPNISHLVCQSTCSCGDVNIGKADRCLTQPVSGCIPQWLSVHDVIIRDLTYDLKDRTFVVSVPIEVDCSPSPCYRFCEIDLMLAVHWDCLVHKKKTLVVRCLHTLSKTRKQFCHTGCLL